MQTMLIPLSLSSPGFSHASLGILPISFFQSGTIATLLVPAASRDAEDMITKAAPLTITGSLDRDA